MCFCHVQYEKFDGERLGGGALVRDHFSRQRIWMWLSW